MSESSIKSGSWTSSANQETEAIPHRIFGRVHLVVLPEIPQEDSLAAFAYFEIAKSGYSKFCLDSGPMNLLMIYDFCKLVDEQILQNLHRSTALCSSDSPEDLTNAAFLLGSYMIIRMDLTWESAMERFSPLCHKFLPYRNISKGPSCFDLNLADCLEALWQAKQHNWIDFSDSGSHSFDAQEYKHLDDPLNADLHEIVPGKLVTMRSPKTLSGGALWHDNLLPDGRFSHRDFSPQYYAEILDQFDVRAVVRLCTPHYSGETLAEYGMATADLFSEDLMVPPPDVVSKFLRVMEAVPGAVAIHGRTGLGRAGVLAALYIMRYYGFSARAAIAWIRIVQPGSIIAEQQTFLLDQEGTIHAMRERQQCGTSNAMRSKELAIPDGRLATAAATQKIIDDTIQRCEFLDSPAFRFSMPSAAPAPFGSASASLAPPAADNRKGSKCPASPSQCGNMVWQALRHKQELISSTPAGQAAADKHEGCSSKGSAAGAGAMGFTAALCRSVSFRGTQFLGLGARNDDDGYESTASAI